MDLTKTVLLLMTGIVAQAPAASSETAALVKAGDKLVEAIKRKDMASLKALTTPDFKVIARGKTYPRDQWIRLTSQMLAMTKIASVTHEITSFRITGKNAILKTKSKVIGTIDIANQKKGQSFSDFSVDEETWAKVGGTWRFQRDNTLSEVTKVNGKVFPAGS